MAPQEESVQNMASADEDVARKVSPEWSRLPAHLEELLYIVPEVSSTLERTTLLTWLYLSRGVLSYESLVERVDIDAFNATKRRTARRAIVGLVRIGAAKLVNFEEGKDTVELVGADLDEEGERTNRIGTNTYAVMTKGGMTWMLRAWGARHCVLDRRVGRLKAVHKTFLDEEEEGKGNEPHWIETLRAGEYTREYKPTGEVTAWIARPVASVFDLHSCLRR